MKAHQLIKLGQDNATVKKLTSTFNEWANNGAPAYIKRARVVFLSKEAGPFVSIGGTRQLAILPLVGKLYEKILLKMVNDHIGEDFFHPAQAAFRKGYSTLTNVKKLLVKMQTMKEQV